MAELQLVFDHGKRHELIASADMLADHVDIIEIGYPELITFGLDVVREIHEAHPNVRLCVDAKVFHGGSGVMRRCFEAGASIVTVLASAPNEIIKQMVRAAREYDGAIMCDLDGVRNLGRRTAEVDTLGVRYCHVSSGFLMEHEYDLMKPRHGSIFQVRPLELVAAVKRNLIHAGLAVGTGINEQNLDQVLAYEPEIVMVGRSILAVDGPYTTSAERAIATADALRARLHAAG
ncbi:MAG: orotidine 5'-phosphate decarboxylase [Acidobacteriota bacterium]|nr:orotidine 5'-phosphate decarboxylase [Acidobacteriota bacterium]